MKKKIGFFGGTFDPIHNGHINLALEIKEKRCLDEVIFCPAYLSPHKIQNPPLASPAQRVKMVQLVIDPIDGFSLYFKEVERGGSSYTIETIKELCEKGEAEYHLIFGEKILEGLHRWMDVEELLNLASPYIGCRRGSGARLSTSLPPHLVNMIEEGRTEIPILDVSSTVIRERIKNKLYCGHLLPPEILDFIFSNGLYL